MRQPTNPCTWFGAGGSYKDQESFIYEGGKHLWYFAPGTEIDEKKFKNCIPISIIFWADNPDHAKNVLERMLKFRLEVHERHVEYEKGNYYNPGGYEGLAELLLSNKDKWIIEEAPVNQFYEVGWASNDTIL